MADYSVYVLHRRPELHPPLHDPERFSDRLLDELANHDGIASAGPNEWEAAITIPSPTANYAFDDGLKIITRAAEAAGLDAWEIADIRVVLADVLDEENSRPTIPDLVSGPEVAKILGVNRQRVHQLSHENPRFPKPLYRLAVGRLWDRRAIELFDKQWERKPGRPPKPDHVREQTRTLNPESSVRGLWRP